MRRAFIYLLLMRIWTHRVRNGCKVQLGFITKCVKPKKTCNMNFFNLPTPLGHTDIFLITFLNFFQHQISMSLHIRPHIPSHTTMGPKLPAPDYSPNTHTASDFITHDPGKTTSSTRFLSQYTHGFTPLHTRHVGAIREFLKSESPMTYLRSLSRAQISACPDFGSMRPLS